MSHPYDAEDFNDFIPPPDDPTTAAKPFRLPEKITKGKRHDLIRGLLRSQQARDISFEAAKATCEIENKLKCDPPLDAKELEYQRWWDAPNQPGFGETKRYPSKPTATLHGFTVQDLVIHTFPVRRGLLYRGDTAVFREGQLGEIYAERGIGKTWLIHTLAMVAAFGVEALGFRNPDPCRVLVIDGEMSSEELQERFAHLARLFDVNLNVKTPLLNGLVVVGADWQDDFLSRLDTPEGQAAIEPFVDPADLLFFDNRSCLFDPEGEKDPTAWQPAQDYLLSLRRRGKATMLGHHSNRQGGARGISKPEDPMNVLLKLTRPEEYTQDQGARFRVEFEKSRGFHGKAASPFIATLTPNGWFTEYPEHDDINQKICDYLRNADALNERPKSANAVVAGAKVNRNNGLEAVGNLVAAGIIEKTDKGYRVVEGK